MKLRSLDLQERFDFLTPRHELHATSNSGPRALEDEGFPFEKISQVAELESWRKEINRPIYHIHKWWAQRLGTVFRAISIGALTPAGTDVMDLFYRPARFRGSVVFDPFMGSGTTLGEAAKLGARTVGCDINPVAYFLVRTALSLHDRSKILAEFLSIERDVSATIRSWYRTCLPDRQAAEVLYFFWVKIVACPCCRHEVDLRSTRVFAHHSYPKRHPEARAICPKCDGICVVGYDDEQTQCGVCGHEFNPHSGPADGRKATCPTCLHAFPIAQTIRKTNRPPEHKLYAKLVLLGDGSKVYASATDDDRMLYESASRELATRVNPYPVVAIEPGHNTNQALNYNYRYWHEMFNDRQLLCLSILSDRIGAIEDPDLRNLFTCLLSGTLEFNNMFASYKGEGTGAVRHMFAHHILKPERVPLEANLWGTSKSSGSFLTMFKNRIRRALDYADDPFELRPRVHAGKGRSEKVFGLSESLGFNVADNYAEFASGKRMYLSCSDSSATDLPDRSVDAILTDPPFFDNVHYSQLADFFHVWQRHILGNDGLRRDRTTRSPSEVQNADVAQFTERLGAVWSEAHRILKDDGVLAFTYHHSRADGWRALLQALMTASFGITAAHPVKAEMTVALPKYQAREPIDLDIIVVCRKKFRLPRAEPHGNLWGVVLSCAASQMERLRATGRSLGRGDVRVIVMAQMLRQLSAFRDIDTALALLEASDSGIDTTITALHGNAGKTGRS